MADSRGPLRRFLERRIGGRGGLRALTATVLLLSFLAATLAGHFLLRAGMADLRWRLPLVVAAAYGSFLVLVWLWLALTGIGRQRVRLDPDHREADPEGRSPGRDFLAKAGDVADGVSSLGDVGSLADAEGCLPAIGFALFLVALGFVLTALWWFFGGFFGAASAALVEAGVESVLAVGMARAAGGGAAGWMAGALRASWKFWLALVALAWGLAAALHALAPEAPTVYRAFAQILS